MKTRRILSTILAIVLVISTFTFGSFTAAAEDPSIVYLSNSGSDANSGTSANSPLRGFAKAVETVADGGTIYIMGTYTYTESNSGSMYPFPTSTKKITIEGYGADAVFEFPAAGQYQGDPQLSFETTFKNVTLNVLRNGAVFTNGNKTTFAGNVSVQNAYVYVGTLTTATASEHFVLDGSNFGTITLGCTAAVITNGNATFELINGSTLDRLNLVQADWNGSGTKGTVKGDLRIRVDGTSTLKELLNDQQKTTFEGSLMAIVEEGSTVPALDATFLSAFKNNGISSTGYYTVLVKNPAGGYVDFGKESGKVDITVNPGYVAMVERSGETFYTKTVEGLPTTFGMGAVTTITFTNAKQAIDQFDLAIVPPTPGESFEIGTVNGATVSIESVYPADVVAGYSKKYTYSVKIQANDPYVFTEEFEFKINGKDRYISGSFDSATQYKISNFTKDSSTITFDYKLDATSPNLDANGKPNEYTLEYNGGVGAAVASGKTVPDIQGYAIINKNADEADWTTGDVVIAAGDLYTKVGYVFSSYYYIDEKTNSEVIVPADSTINLTQNTKLYAKWTKLPSTAVNFQGNGATWGSMSTITGKYAGDTIILPFCEYAAPAGHSFAGWLNTLDNNVYQPGDQYVIPAAIPAAFTTNTGDATLSFTATWTARAGGAGTIYYVSKTGDDQNNDGLSAAAPLATINGATVKAKAEGKTDITVIVIDSAILTGLDEDSDHQLTIMGASESSVLEVLSSIYLQRPTRIENIHLDVTSGVCVYTNGKAAEFGPNLPNKTQFKLDIADGAEGDEIDGVNTIFNSGVYFGNYNFGGKYVSGKANLISGDSYVTFNNGSNFEKIDISPINASGRRKSVRSDYNITFNINAFFIEFTASDSVENLFYDPNGDSKLVLLFNNGTLPTIPANLAVDNIVYIVDAGPGGNGTIINKDNNPYFSSVAGSYVYANSNETVAYNQPTPNAAGNIASFRLTDYVINGSTNSTNKVRFGTPIDAATISLTTNSQPTAGVNISSVAVPAIDCANCYVAFDIEKPWNDIDGNFFGYGKKYTANFVITPMTGYFFNDFAALPVITVDGNAVSAQRNADGTVSLAYEFPNATDYEAPEVSVSFVSCGETVSHSFSEPPVHLGEIVLPPVPANKPFTQYFAGWEYNGEAYPASATYKIVDDVDHIQFVAKWETYSTINFPTVLLLYDYSAQGADLGRNPQFSPSANAYLAEGTLVNLEHPIGGTTQAPTKTFDREKVTCIESDGSDKSMWINETSLSSHKLKAGEYKYMTVVYYYKSKAGTAVGEHGKMTFGSCILPNGSVSKWFAQPVVSKDEVVANKWATMTFDLTTAIEKSGVDENATFAQFHILPIGDLTCEELDGDTLYLKALYFSKEPPLTKEQIEG